MGSGTRIAKRDIRVRCGTCRRSTEPGWLCLGGGDWVECPECNAIGGGVRNDTPGFFGGLESQITPTRRIFLPAAPR